MINHAFWLLLFATFLFLCAGVGFRRLGFHNISNFCLVFCLLITLLASASIGVESSM